MAVLFVGAAAASPPAMASTPEPDVDIVVQAGHADFLDAVSLPGNTRYVTSGRDGTVKLVDREGTMWRTIAVCDYWITELSAISHNRVAAECGDNKTYLVDLDTGQSRDMQVGGGESLGLSASSDHLVSRSASNGSTVLHARGNSRVVFQAAMRAPRVDSLSWSANGFLALGMEDGRIQLWDTESGVPVQTIDAHEGPVHSLSLVGSGATILSGSFDDAVKEFSFRDNRVRETWRLKPLEQYIGRDEWDRIRFAARKSKTPVKTPRAPFGLSADGDRANTDELYQLGFSADGRYIVATGRGDFVQLIDRRTSSSRNILSGDYHDTVEIRGGAFTRDGAGLAVLYPRAIRIYDTRSTDELQRIAVDGRHRSILVTSEARPNIFVGGTAGEILGFDFTNGRPTHRFPVSSTISTLAHWESSNTLVAAASDSLIRLFSLDDGRTRALRGHTSAVSALAVHPTKPILVSAGEDGSVIFWNLETGEMLATLVTASETDWIVADRNGYFDGPTNSWRRAMFRVADRLFAPEQLATRFWQPGLLERVLGETHAFAKILAERGDEARSDIAQLLDAKPPSVRVSLADGVRDRQRVQTVNVRVSDNGSGAQDLRVFRNGTVVYRQGDGSEQGVTPVQITLLRGENQITAYAFSREGVRSAVASMVVNGPSVSPVEPTLHVLAVGVDDYEDKPLQYAGADAEAIEAGFRGIHRGRFQWRGETLTDTRATKSAVRDSLQEIARSANPEDIVVFFFSGHGVRYDDQLHLLPFDYAPIDPAVDELTTISDADLQAWLDPIDAARIMLIIDACHAGQALESADSRWGPMNSKGLGQLAFEKGIYVVGASQGYQAAVENTLLGHGLLTYALILEGLQQMNADFRPPDDNLYAEELFAFVRTRVPQLQIDQYRRRDIFYDPALDETDVVQSWVQIPKIYYPPQFDQDKLLLRTR